MERDLFDHFPQIHRDRHVEAARPLRPGFLRRDGHAVVARAGIVGPDFRPDAILERCDDLAARRVVLGVRGEHQHDVQLQPERIPLDLNIALLQDVEQSHLNLASQIGQLVDREDAPVRPWQQSVVHRQFVGEIEARLGRLDGIDVAQHVGDGHVGRCELLDVSRLARHPGDRHVVPVARDALPARSADRCERIVVDLAAWDDRHPLVEQIDQSAEDPALRLSAKAEQDEVMTREDGIDELRDDGFAISNDAGEQRFVGLKLPNQVVADFLLDRPGGGTESLAQLAKRLNGSGHPPILSR